jgi:hypothetical protein
MASSSLFLRLPTLILMASLSTGALTGCGALSSMMGAAGIDVPRIQERVLVPSQIGSQWSFLDAANPFEAEASRVDYVVTGMATFDQYFLQVAQLQGQVTLARDTIALVNQVLDGDLISSLFTGAYAQELISAQGQLQPGEQRRFVTALMSGNLGRAQSVVPSLTEARFTGIREEFFGRYPQLPQIAQRLVPATEGLVGIPGSVSGLVSTGQNLVSAAPSEFVGPQAINAPRVVTELTQSISNISEIGTTAVELGQQMTELFN